MPLPDDIAFATVTELGRRLRAGEFNSVELTEFFLNRNSQIADTNEFQVIVLVPIQLAWMDPKMAC
jgi:hypothetical protein